MWGAAQASYLCSQPRCVSMVDSVWQVCLWVCVHGGGGGTPHTQLHAHGSWLSCCRRCCFASQAGAKAVYGIECSSIAVQAKQIVADNHLLCLRSLPLTLLLLLLLLLLLPLCPAGWR